MGRPRAGSSASESRCMRGFAIRPPTEFGADKAAAFLIKLICSQRGGIASCPSKTTCIFDLFVVPGFLQGCFSRFFSAPLASSSLRFLSANPQSAEAHYILGVLLKERGRLEGIRPSNPRSMASPDLAVFSFGPAKRWECARRCD